MESLIQYYGDTNQGKVRETNEDAFCAQSIWEDKYILLLVVDGCGGYEGGEVASDIARKVIPEYLCGYTGGTRLELLKQAVIMANNRIHDARDTDKRLEMMGCVLTAAIIDKSNDLMLIAHVGDTRCYVYDGKELKKVTRDHSMIGELEDQGYLTEREAMTHPSRSIIDRMIGDEYHNLNDQFVDATIYPLPPTYQIMLCSDGLTDYVSSIEIRSILSKNYSTEDKVKCLIDLANSKGGRDNITVVIANKN